MDGTKKKKEESPVDTNQAQDALNDFVNVLTPLNREQQIRVLATVIVFFGMEREIRSTLEN